MSPAQIGLTVFAATAVTPKSGSSWKDVPLYVEDNGIEFVAVMDHVTTALVGVATGIVAVQSLPTVLTIAIPVWGTPLNE